MASSETKVCQNCKAAFVIDAQDFDFYEKIQVPPPTWCPQCRTIRRFSFWNERNLFRATDAKTGEEIFSGYPRSSGLKLYDHDFWWSDKWDPFVYGREYDFSRPFLEQFRALLYEVPLPARSIWHLTGSGYCNNASRLRNCYLCFDADESEDCFYGIGFRHSKSSIDFAQANYLEWCYEVFSCDRCYQTFFTVESDDCRSVWFSLECYDCSNCFGCVNLKHKRYHIFNVPYTKDEYERKLREFNLGSYAALVEIKKRVYDFWRRFPVKYMRGTHNENVIGEHVYHAKNIKYCYQCDKSIKDLTYCQRVVNNTAMCYDYTHWGDNSELMYEALTCGESCRNVKFCFDCWPACEDIAYCIYCHSSTNLFGCVGLKRKSYCILNTQYTKEAFETLKAKIIAHMHEVPYVDAKGRVYRYGEFFPPGFSPIAYHETLAQDFFPLTKEEAEKQGFLWREPEKKEFKITLAAEELPDHVSDVRSEICREIIACDSCRQAYRILPLEFEFYKRFTLPLPRLCHHCRYAERMRMRNPIAWSRRHCMCEGRQSIESNVGIQYANSVAHVHGPSPCPQEFETPYTPDRPEIVYCESCFQAEIA